MIYRYSVSDVCRFLENCKRDSSMLSDPLGSRDHIEKMLTLLNTADDGSVETEVFCNFKELCLLDEGFRRSAELILEEDDFGNSIELEICDDFQNVSNYENTQRTGTVATYAQIKEHIEIRRFGDYSVLDYGSGKGWGSMKFKGCDSYEPFWSGFGQRPTYEHNWQIDKKYDVILCVYVLNVVSFGVRSRIVEHICRLLNDDGCAYFVVRGKDIFNLKGKYSHFSEKEIITSIGTFQKCFNQKELSCFLLNEANDSGLGSFCVHRPDKGVIKGKISTLLEKVK